MLDPEAIVIRGGMFTLVLIGMVRLVWHDFNCLRNDVRRRRRKQLK